MKHLLQFICLASLLLVPLGCKKSEADVDPRDQYVGTYSPLSGTQSLASVSLKTGQGTLSTFPAGGGTLVISKGPGSDELVFAVENNSNLTLKLESNTFVIQPSSVGDKTSSGYAYTKLYEGRGFFVNSKLNVTLSYTAKTDQYNVRSELTVSGPKQ